jgi:hypothetical protein
MWPYCGQSLYMTPGQVETPNSAKKLLGVSEVLKTYAARTVELSGIVNTDPGAPVTATEAPLAPRLSVLVFEAGAGQVPAATAETVTVCEPLAVVGAVVGETGVTVPSV